MKSPAGFVSTPPCKRVIYKNGEPVRQDVVYALDKPLTMKPQKGRKKTREQKPRYEVKSKCRACKSRSTDWHKHHVIYDPDWVVRLCIPCHKIITGMNF